MYKERHIHFERTAASTSSTNNSSKGSNNEWQSLYAQRIALEANQPRHWELPGRTHADLRKYVFESIILCSVHTRISITKHKYMHA